jgi:hypothetical protein
VSHDPDAPGRDSPVRRVAILQPEDARGDVGRHVLDVGRADQLLRAGRREDLDGVIAVTVGARVQRALDARVGLVWEPDPDKATIVKLDPADVLTTADSGEKLAPLIKPPPSFDEMVHEATPSELTAP